MLEHWHPQLMELEAALVFSTVREVVLSTRVARILALVNMMNMSCSLLKDKIVLEFQVRIVVYIQGWLVGRGS